MTTSTGPLQFIFLLLNHLYSEVVACLPINPKKNRIRGLYVWGIYLVGWLVFVYVLYVSISASKAPLVDYMKQHKNAETNRK